jgi:hypothetical protein
MLAGLGAVIVVAVAAATVYLVAFHPAATHHAPPLPTRVVSYQTVGLVVTDTQPGASSNQLLQLASDRGALQFSPVAQTQQTQGSPQWTADLMAGTTYIFIYLPTGQCLSAVGTSSQPKLALRHCNLGSAQRWRRAGAAVLTQGHDFYQYASVSGGDCLTQTGVLPGPVVGASLQPCSSPQSGDQLLAFWWSSV